MRNRKTFNERVEYSRVLPLWVKFDFYDLPDLDDGIPFMSTAFLGTESFTSLVG